LTRYVRSFFESLAGGILNNDKSFLSSIPIIKYFLDNLANNEKDELKRVAADIVAKNSYENIFWAN